MGKKKNFENKETFAERHPRINAIIGLCILLAGIFLAFVLIRIIILQIGQGIEQIINFLKNFQISLFFLQFMCYNNMNRILCGKAV